MLIIAFPSVFCLAFVLRRKTANKAKGSGMGTRGRVIAGIDTHKDSHVLCLLDGLGRKILSDSFPANETGYQRLADTIGNPENCIVVGMEGTASFGAGLNAYLAAMDYKVVEVLRPKRDKRIKGKGKSDAIDAEIAARNAASGYGTSVPKSHNNWVEGIRVLMVARNLNVQTATKTTNTVKSLIITAPEDMRAKYGKLNAKALMSRLSRSHSRAEDTASDCLMSALQTLARTWLELEKRSCELLERIESILGKNAPALLELPGCGAVNAADLIIAAGGNPERLHSESAFASFCGVSPIEASSGQVTRHRLNRGGNRAANRALHMIVVSRMRSDPRTAAYIERRTSEGKAKREIMRCLKRYVAREVYSALLHPQDTKYPKGAELADARILLGISQKEIAGRLGVSNARISEIERGKRLHSELRQRYQQFLSECRFSKELGVDTI